jgi:hypothetical protein
VLKPKIPENRTTMDNEIKIIQTNITKSKPPPIFKVNFFFNPPKMGLNGLGTAKKGKNLPG